MKKLIEAAHQAQKEGYTHMYSVVKTVYTTTYVHCNSITDIIAANCWIPAPNRSFGWHGPIGVTFKNRPANSINKTDAIKSYCV